MKSICFILCICAVIFCVQSNPLNQTKEGSRGSDAYFGNVTKKEPNGTLGSKTRSMPMFGGIAPQQGLTDGQFQLPGAQGVPGLVSQFPGSQMLPEEPQASVRTPGQFFDSDPQQQRMVRCQVHEECGPGNFICSLSLCVPAVSLGTACGGTDLQCEMSTNSMAVGCKAGICYAAVGGNMGGNHFPPGLGQCSNGGTALYSTRCGYQGFPGQQQNTFQQCPFGTVCDYHQGICCSNRVPTFGGNHNPWWYNPNNPFQPGQFGLEPFNNQWPNQLPNFPGPNQFPNPGLGPLPGSGPFGGNFQNQELCYPNEFFTGQTCVWSQTGSTQCPQGAYCRTNGVCCVATGPFSTRSQKNMKPENGLAVQDDGVLV